ncbi:ABC transporter permease [Bdellovibrio sp. HCB337]|uniref:ABC transporter permease n=1 Tax=Bdellovibrio sp. HCB337 TaxID=3394358 RepID=UPI0039A46438
MKNSRVNVPALVSFALFIALFETAVRLSWIPEYLFPAPSTVLNTLFENKSDFTKAFLETLQGSLAGLVLSILFGNLLAVLFSLSEFLKKSILPFAIFFQTVPIIAIAPLLVIYFGFGMPTVVAASFIVSVFPIIANTLLGLEGVPRAELELFKLYGANAWQTLWKLKIPSAYSSSYAGLKVSIGLAIIGAIAGEFVAGGGLGAMIDSARTQQRIDIVFAALGLLSLMGLGCIFFLKVIHRTLQQIRPYALNLKD